MTTPRNNYIFVDYENVQELELRLIRDKPVKVVLVVGRQQQKLPTALTREALSLGAKQVEIVESGCNGKNAVDLVLAYHLGKRAKEDPDGYFHILSKDKDFDPLVAHLRAEEVRVSRAEVFGKISVLVDLQTIPLVERTRQVNDRIGKLKPDGRPKKLKALRSMIHSQFFKLLSEDDVEAVVEQLVKEKAITLSDKDSVGYPPCNS